MAGSVGQYTVGILPWSGRVLDTGPWTRTNDSTWLGMGYSESATAQNDEIGWDVWLDAGTWKVALIYRKNTNQGIYHVRFDAVDVGTIDGYAASLSVNNYGEVASLSVTTPKVVRVSVKMATKNASSTGYVGDLASVALIRTAGTGSTPAGTDTPGYTWIYLPFMGTKSNTLWATRTQSSTELGGGRLVTDTTAQNNLFTVDVWVDTGTYKVALVHGKDATFGIVNLTGINGTQTFDGYAAAPASNAYTEVTAITVAAAGVMTLTFTMATKNASSSAYGAALNSIALVRTGA